MAAAVTPRARRVTSPGELGEHRLDHAADPRRAVEQAELSGLVAKQAADAFMHEPFLRAPSRDSKPLRMVDHPSL
jgi:hypothetical protein